MNPAPCGWSRSEAPTRSTENTAEAILSATDELMREILDAQPLGAGDLVSCIFTLTPDLDAEFPAVAAREMGLSSGAAAVRARDPGAGRAAERHPGADPRLHARRPPPEHVYLGEAVKLRLDLQGAQ